MTTVTHQEGCKTSGCDRGTEGFTGLCRKHYERQRRINVAKNPPRVCELLDCERTHEALGLCARHYKSRWIQGERTRPCSEEGCESQYYSGKLCRKHYVLYKNAGKSSCDGPECSRAIDTLGLCRYHQRQKNVLKQPLTAIPVKSPRKRRRGIAQTVWRKDKDGYVQGSVLTVSGGCRQISQHRYVMEQYLGRELRGKENVHHLNGVRDDNRLENLELWSTSQPPGQRVSDKTSWALEWLREYSPENLL